jgi:hypothetical protein
VATANNEFSFSITLDKKKFGIYNEKTLNMVYVHVREVGSLAA